VHQTPDLDVDGIHEQNRVDRIERALGPLGHLLEDFVGDREIVSLLTFAP
jgi:hypothetical protein